MVSDSAAMADLEARLKGLEFEFLGDTDGTATWKAAIDKVKAEVGDGFDVSSIMGGSSPTTS